MATYLTPLSLLVGEVTTWEVEGLGDALELLETYRIFDTVIPCPKLGLLMDWYCETPTFSYLPESRSIKLWMRLCLTEVVYLASDKALLGEVLC